MLRSIQVLSPVVGGIDGTLNIVGDRVALEVLGETVASADGYRPGVFATSDERIAGDIGSFLAHAIESGDDDAWDVIGPRAAEWAEALCLMGDDAGDVE